MSTQTVIIELPEAVYRAAVQIADVTGQPLAAVLQASITQALPPLDDVHPDEAADLDSLELLDDGGLWQAARAELTPDEQHAMHQLLDGQNADTLTGSESARLQELLVACGRLTVRKAHAYLLLARRGYRVPMQETSA